MRARKAAARAGVPSGLLSILTAVWDGSPPKYLRKLCRRIAQQNVHGACEWIIVDNGCARRSLRDLLARIGQQPWTRIIRHDKNDGIAAGLRSALEAATNDYVLPVDGDDLLYPDTLSIVAAAIEQNDYPALLYSDEDKIDARGISEPYFKPDWDPVLLSNSAYCAHLGVMRRTEALRLGVYTDAAVEGSVDWDAFLRFTAAGHGAVHIPEVLYHWRIHAESTAHRDAAKDYIASSQRAALERWLLTRSEGEKFTVESSPLFRGGSHFRIRRIDVPSSGLEIVPVTETTTAEDLLARLPGQHTLTCLMDSEIVADDFGWQSELVGLFELFEDTAIVGGRLRNAAGIIVDADRHFGFGHDCASPNAGRHANDPGYFGQLWKTRSVPAVGPRWMAARTDDWRRWLGVIHRSTPIKELGAQLCARARDEGRRVIYSPFLSGTVQSDWAADCLSSRQPDRRYYPEPLSLEHGFEIG